MTTETALPTPSPEVRDAAVVGGTALVAAAVIAGGWWLWRRRGLSSPYYAGPVVPGGTLMSRFGTRTKNGVVGQHDGVDLQARRGTPIRAAGAGVVMGVWQDGGVPGYGNLVILKHGPGEGTLYAHMDTIDPAMRAGAMVYPGQAVGTVGCTDSTASGFPCDGSHLHFEVFRPDPSDDRAFTHFNGGVGGHPARQDPQQWAAERGIRLIG